MNTATKQRERCFACGKRLRRTLAAVQPIAITSDLAQVVSVGTDCFKRVLAAGDSGYQPPQGGPRLLVLTAAREKQLRINTNEAA